MGERSAGGDDLINDATLVEDPILIPVLTGRGKIRSVGIEPFHQIADEISTSRRTPRAYGWVRQKHPSCV